MGFPESGDWPTLRVVKRFRPDADAGARKEFGKALIEALDKMEVPGGAEFYVGLPSDIEAMRDRVEEVAQEREDEIRAAREAEQERDAALREVDEIIERLADVGRGIITLDELIQMARDGKLR